MTLHWRVIPKADGKVGRALELGDVDIFWREGLSEEYRR